MTFAVPSNQQTGCSQAGASIVSHARFIYNGCARPLQRLKHLLLTSPGCDLKCELVASPVPSKRLIVFPNSIPVPCSYSRFSALLAFLYQNQKAGSSNLSGRHASSLANQPGQNSNLQFGSENLQSAQCSQAGILSWRLRSEPRRSMFWCWLGFA